MQTSDERRYGYSVPIQASPAHKHSTLYGHGFVAAVWLPQSAAETTSLTGGACTGVIRSKLIWLAAGRKFGQTSRIGLREVGVQRHRALLNVGYTILPSKPPGCTTPLSVCAASAGVVRPVTWSRKLETASVKGLLPCNSFRCEVWQDAWPRPAGVADTFAHHSCIINGVSGTP
jgi:hypothetical protein